MTIIDLQVHAYEANTPKRPWHSVPNWPAHVTGDEMVAAMDKVGVDGAIFISALSMYQLRRQLGGGVWRAAHPNRMAIVKPVDLDDPAVADVIADWKKTPGTVGIRTAMTKEAGRELTDPPSTESCARRCGTTSRSTCCAGATSMPARPSSTAIPRRASSSITSPILQPARTAPRRRSPGPTCRRCWSFRQASERGDQGGPAAPAPCRASPTLSRDIWDPLARVFDAWGFNRCLWGTDWTRGIRGRQLRAGREAFPRNQAPERRRANAMLMGGACAKAWRLVAEEGLVSRFEVRVICTWRLIAPSVWAMRPLQRRSTDAASPLRPSFPLRRERPEPDTARP